MAGIRAKNTKPEILVRKLLHRSGFRFSLHRRDLTGNPDIVLPKWRTVIFVHGCFWHGHENCPIFRLPKTRTKFWAEKISKNKERDERNRQFYESSDWSLIEVWECSLKGRTKLSPEQVKEQLAHLVSATSVKIGVIRGQTL